MATEGEDHEALRETARRLLAEKVPGIPSYIVGE